MGSLRCGWCTAIAVIFLLLVFLPACGGHKPAGASPFPVSITLSPSPSVSLQLGSVQQFTATAVNNTNSHISPTFTYSVTSSTSNSVSGGILDIAPGGIACAGNWNAPLYTICTPAGIGAVEVTASALGASSAPTWVFVHPPIASIQVKILPPVNSPPPACPNQIALPLACDIKFTPTSACLSTNQVENLQAIALDSNGNDITPSVGPFTWTASNASVATLTPILNPSYNVATNQVAISPGAPGQTQIIASASGVYSQPSNVLPQVSTFETCPVQCIDLELGTNGEFTGQTSFVAVKGTSETITATAVDVQGCIVPKPPLTWTSSQPAAVSAGGSAGCTGSTCTVSTTQPGAGVVTASCTPPTCNVGFPLNLNSAPAPFIPQPVYPITGISGLITGTPASTGVLATSQDCYSNPICGVALYDLSSTTNAAGSPISLPSEPNSLLFDPPGDKAYMGSEFGAFVINPADIGTSTNPFTSLPASGTPLGFVTGKVIAVSRNGSQAIFSDTVSTPNKVYVVSSSSIGSTVSASTTQLNINSAIAATFSPDGLKAFILGDSGTTLYVYSPLQALQEIANPLPTPATSIAFNSTGSFALLAGGGTSTDLAVYHTCDNSLLSPALLSGNLTSPPLLLKMVPPGNVSLSTALLPAALESAGLDFFFGVDNTGVDVIATTSTEALAGTLCPQGIGPALPKSGGTPFPPTHIDISHGTFHPLNFFVSPDATQVYIVTSDQGILTYSFNTGATLGIPLSNNAAPLAADMTVDGTLIYVAGTDGLLHQLVTQTASEQEAPISFPALPNSANSFCYSSFSCALDIVAVKP